MQNNEKNKYMWRVAKLCSTLLFALFSFFYLYSMQSELLACFQYILSDGLTSYSPFVGSMLLTLLLVFVGEVLAYAWGLPMAFVALSYFPSAILLALISGGSPVQGGISGSGILWGWLAFVLVLGSVAVILLRKYASYIVREKYQYTDMWPNAVFLTLLFLFVGAAGNSNEALHYQLKAERLLCEERYDEIAELRCPSSRPAPVFCAIRSLALAHEHRLGDELFRVPQTQKAMGLMASGRDFLSCDSLEYRFYEMWGARPGKHIVNNPELFFKMVVDRHVADTLQNSVVADYYLCSLLLDRKLDQFAAEVGEYYLLNDSLPRHYREALVLYKRLRTNPVCIYENESLEEDYSDFLSLSREKALPEVRRNRMRKAYGKTYWYYYTCP